MVGSEACGVAAEAALRRDADCSGTDDRLAGESVHPGERAGATAQMSDRTGTTDNARRAFRKHRSAADGDCSATGERTREIERAPVDRSSAGIVIGAHQHGDPGAG